jgi:hypothetical protein
MENFVVVCWEQKLEFELAPKWVAAKVAWKEILLGWKACVKVEVKECSLVSLLVDMMDNQSGMSLVETKVGKKVVMLVSSMGQW